MQPRVTQAGPLLAGAANKIALVQTPTAAGALALNGAAGAAVANNICLSQGGTAGVALTINGALAQTAYRPFTSQAPKQTVAALQPASPIYLTSAGNDSAITFAVVGKDVNGAVQTETRGGVDIGVVASTKTYQEILSVTPSGNTASTVTVGSMGFATLDAARNVIFTSSGDDASLTITISGTDWAGAPISETVVGGDAAAASTVLDYLTVTEVLVSGATAGTIEVGTNGVAGSPWINLDPWAAGTLLGQCAVSGTVSYTVEITNDDPDSYANPVARSAVIWDSTLPDVATKTASMSFGLAQAPLWARVVLNSSTNPGFVRMTLVQHSSVTY